MEWLPNLWKAWSYYSHCNFPSFIQIEFRLQNSLYSDHFKNTFISLTEAGLF